MTTRPPQPDATFDADAWNAWFSVIDDAGRDGHAARRVFDDLLAIRDSLTDDEARAEGAAFGDRIVAENDRHVANGCSRVYWSGFCAAELDAYDPADVLAAAHADPFGDVLAELRAHRAEQAAERG